MGADTLLYVHTDHLGSIVALANANGGKLAEYSYDPWGRLRDPLTLQPYSFSDAPSLRLGRGFTGHEHLPEFGLINMNARLYDPLLGRFLSPDPYVVNPDFLQDYNRYTYARNNPLVYVDPNGESILLACIIGGAILGAYLGGSAAEGNLDPTEWKWDKNTWVGMGIGLGVGALGGWGFSVAAPALAGTSFFSYFGASGTIAAYGAVGTLAGGAIGYGTGLGTGLYMSGGDWSYANQLGGIMSGVGSQIGSVIGTLAGGWEAYQEQMKSLQKPISIASNDATTQDFKNPVYYNEALTYEGVPYLWGGTDRNGIDCSGLVNVSVGNTGERWYTSSMRPIPGLWDRVNVRTATRGDFYADVFKGDLFLWKGHTAFYAGQGSLFHAHGVQGTPVGYTGDLSWYLRTKGYPSVYRQRWHTIPIPNR